MTRLLVPSKSFLRTAKRLVKRRPDLGDAIRSTLQQLKENAFHPSLKTHKLSGNLEGRWACSAGYDLRIVIRFVKHDDAESIHLLSLGTHNDVY